MAEGAMVPTDDSVKGVIINPFGKLYPLGKETGILSETFEEGF